MTAPELAYLAAGAAIGVPATILVQRYLIRWQHRRARRRTRLRLVTEPTVTTRYPGGWHPSHGRPDHRP